MDIFSVLKSTHKKQNKYRHKQVSSVFERRVLVVKV